jgi:hypothetical protein
MKMSVENCLAAIFPGIKDGAIAIERFLVSNLASHSK